MSATKKRSSEAGVVASKKIANSKLLVALPRSQHLYGYPFVVLYAAWCYGYFFEFDTYFGSNEIAWVFLLLCISLQTVAYLSTQWSIFAQALLTCSPTSDVSRAELILVQPERGAGKGEICVLQKSGDDVWFSFQKRKFVYNSAEKRFKKVFSPWTGKHNDGVTLGHALAHAGIQDSASLRRSETQYGKNEFDIPLPQFLELLKEHMVAPFFVFQVFCVLLWLMDGSILNSLFTLLMLVIFESTVVFQRLRTLREFRTMSLKPYDVLAFRFGEWREVKTTDLVPLDIVALERHRDESLAAPCDILLLRGSCIVNEAMLSGESTPQQKEGIHLCDMDEPLAPIKSAQQKNRIIFGGTKILQASSRDASLIDGPVSFERCHDCSGPWDSVKVPENMCVGLVLRTGFSTTQGKLVRTIIYSAERLSANNAEALGFILFLLVFAIAASGYVYWHSFFEPDRKPNKVLLHCIMILTSCVPPELPMQLSLAVNNSLLALYRRYIYVTEPFRIPIAGRLNVMCFDKTGTLTDVNLRAEGVCSFSYTSETKPEVKEFTNAQLAQGLPTELKSLEKAEGLHLSTTLAIAGSQALVILDGDIVGDSMEKCALDYIGWSITKDNDVVPITPALRAVAEQERRKFSTDITPPERAQSYKLHILRRFAFASDLKRMSSLSLVHCKGERLDHKSLFVACKGAPEVLKPFFKTVPKNYDETFRNFAREGSRVLAIAWKWLNAPSSKLVSDFTREEVESDLNFAGFLVFYCPLRKDSKEAVKMLQDSLHTCVMITGDNPLTACHVAQSLSMVSKPLLVGDISADKASVIFRSADKAETEMYRISEFASKDSSVPVLPAPTCPIFSHDVCLTGGALELLANSRFFHRFLCLHTKVYARTSPSQKEDIINCLKGNEFVTLMCGDGTNDVGALKQADVGVALLDHDIDEMPAIEKQLRIKQMEQRRQQAVAQRERLEKQFGVSLPPLPAEKNLQPNTGEDAVTLFTETNKLASQIKDPRRRQQMQMEAAKQMLSMTLQDANSADEAPVLKLGDASVAAPFTSKVSSVMSVCHIVRQGRATLVALTQTYKILALNSLTQAYYLAILYYEGVKTGDWQGTFMGILMVFCVFNIANSRPLERLSAERPHSNIFNPYILFSVLGQAFVHVGALMLVRRLALDAGGAEQLEENALDDEFRPNLLNTSIYLISLSMQVATFGINYQGHPFRESLIENRYLWRSLQGSFLVSFLAALEWFPSFNQMIELVPLPYPFKNWLILIMLADILLAFLVERVCIALFSNKKPRKAF